ncbi:hypothetical protein XENOCAPTIV_029390, partial [Xenoophorus captivus]
GSLYELDKVTELKSLANHVVVGSVSCEMLDLFCPLPQTLAVDINDLGTVKLNLEVTWRSYIHLQHTPLITAAVLIIQSDSLRCFRFSVRSTGMTRRPRPAQFPNDCCPIRALLTRRLCESRSFM